jgi:hypothetical protein
MLTAALAFFFSLAYAVDIVCYVTSCNLAVNVTDLLDLFLWGVLRVLHTCGKK